MSWRQAADFPPEKTRPRLDRPVAIADNRPAMSDAAAALPATSLRGLLQHRHFRAVWVASALYFAGNAMQAMAAAWLMVELTGSSFLAALVQTAVFLPMFLLALPAGVLADTTDRKRLLMITLAVQAGAIALLGLLMALHVAGPATILLLTFVSGSTTAMLSPAWNSSVAEILPREQLPHAIAATSVAYNAARAVGPATAGVVYGLAGGGAVMVLAVAGALIMARAFALWPPRPHPASRLPAERLWGGTLAGLRYARHSHTILAQLVRTAAFGSAGSALWALLPAIGSQRLGLGAAGFGLMMGCMGAGAVSVGLVIATLRRRFGLETLVAASCVVFAAAMAVSGLSKWQAPVYLALVAGGGAWTAAMSTFNTATQTSAPPWVRSRASALHVLSALGAFAIGSAVWGVISGIAGLPAALSLAALLMVAGLLLRRRFALRMGEAQDVTPVATFEELLIADEPPPDAGPVAVELSYRIRPEDAERFLAAVSQLRAPRRRDGATFWRIYRDLGDPSRYVERFIVTSWADYLHQRARTTLADQELEARVRDCLAPGETVLMQHYIAER
jgi:MFS family permease